MSKTNIFPAITLLLIIMWTISACGEDNSTEKDDIIIQDTVKFDKNIAYIKYDIPLPIELFTYCYQQKIFDASNLAKQQEHPANTSITATAQKLGLFSADLAYTTLIGNGQSTIDYTNICRQYAELLDLHDAYNPHYLDRIKDNINNTDSLMLLTNQMYTKTCDMLEQRGDKNILPFVIYAGWIESVYLTFYSNDKKNTAIDTNLIVEKINFDNLIEYLYDVQIETSAYYYNDDLKKIIMQLSDLKLITEDANSSYQEKFIKIKQRINELRAKILSL